MSELPKMPTAEVEIDLNRRNGYLGQNHQDFRAYQHELKNRANVKVAKSGGGAKERARRLKKLGITADLSEVPSPGESDGQGT